MERKHLVADGLYYVREDGLYFYTPDGMGGFWYDTLKEAQQQHGLAKTVVNIPWLSDF